MSPTRLNIIGISCFFIALSAWENASGSENALERASGSKLLLKGQMVAEVNWDIDPGTREDVLRGFVEFVPNAETPICENIRLIQTARVQTNGGEDYSWGPGEAPRNLIKTKGKKFQ